MIDTLDLCKKIEAIDTLVSAACREGKTVGEIVTAALLDYKAWGDEERNRQIASTSQPGNQLEDAPDSPTAHELGMEEF